MWTVKLPASAESTPITYADAKGQQYIAVVATGGFGIGAALASDSLVVFSLSGESTRHVDRVACLNRRTLRLQRTPLPLCLPRKIICRLGPGHDLTVRVCSGCHSPDLAASQHLSAQEWNSLVQDMSARGAVATDEEFDQITDYLAKSFPRTAPPPQ